MAKIRPKAPTKGEQIEALQEQVKELQSIINTQQAEIQRLEHDVEQSRPVRVLKRLLEEEVQTSAGLRSHIDILRSDRDALREELYKLHDSLPDRNDGEPVYTEEQLAPAKRGRPRIISDKDRSEVIRLRSEGHSIRKISELTQISTGQVSNILREKREQTEKDGSVYATDKELQAAGDQITKIILAQSPEKRLDVLQHFTDEIAEAPDLGEDGKQMFLEWAQMLQSWTKKKYPGES